MKIQLIYSKEDRHLIEIFKRYTYSLVNERKVEFVSERADSALLFFSPSLTNDVFCYQSFLTAKYLRYQMRPVLLRYWASEPANIEFEEMLKLPGGINDIPSTNNYIYNHDGSFRSHRYNSLDAAWNFVMEDLKYFIKNKN